MKITNNMTLMPGLKQKNIANQNKSNINFGTSYTEVIETGKIASKGLKELGKVAGNIAKNETKDVKQSVIMNCFEAVTKKLAKLLPKEANAETLAYVVVLGNSAKELMGTMIYTVQALTNEDLAPDKRKFVGMYDLAVGIMSTSLGLVAGLAMVKGQGRLIEKLIGGDKAKNLPGYAKAAEGIGLLIPVVLQNIIIKRIIAPAVATPIAGKLKNQMENKEAKQTTAEKASTEKVAAK